MESRGLQPVCCPSRCCPYSRCAYARRQPGVDALARRKLLDASGVPALKGDRSHRALAFELLGIAGLLRQHWPQVAGKTGCLLPARQTAAASCLMASEKNVVWSGLVWSGKFPAMKVDTISEAKAQLSALLDRALAGEEVIIGRAGKPAVRLVPLVQRAEQRRPGTLKGQLRIAHDFDEPPLVPMR